MKDRAQLVVIGAGIVGASAAYHLAELGDHDVLVLDQGPLFETGGSTSHAPGLVFQTNGSRTMCRIAQYTVELYADLELDGAPAWYGVGGIEVATTPERMQELQRRRGYAHAYGIEDTELLSPEETAERIPLLDPGRRSSARTSCRRDGVAKAVRLAAALGAKARSARRRVRGRRHASPGSTSARAASTACRPIAATSSASASWSAPASGGRRSARMAGVPIPLVAVQHQLVWTEPFPELAGDAREVVHPILRHQDVVDVLPATRRPLRASATTGTSRSVDAAASSARTGGGRCSRALMPFTPEDFEVAARPRPRGCCRRWRAHAADRRRPLDQRHVLVHAGRRLDRRRVGERSAASGSARRSGSRTAAAWAGWSPSGWRRRARLRPRARPTRTASTRSMTTPPYVRARGAQQYREVYDILHPLQQMARAARAAADAVLRAARGRSAPSSSRAPAGSGPQWFEANRALLDGAPWEPRDGLGGAELVAGRRRGAPRRRASASALFDITAVREVRRRPAPTRSRSSSASARTGSTGPSARSSTRRCSRRRAGSGCDLTVTRKDEELFRVVTGGGAGQHDLAWLRAQLRDGERVTITVRTGSLFALGLWGPQRARRARRPSPTSTCRTTRSRT